MTSSWCVVAGDVLSTRPVTIIAAFEAEADAQAYVRACQPYNAEPWEVVLISGVTLPTGIEVRPAQSIAPLLKIDLPAQTGWDTIGLERMTGFATVEAARAYLRTHAFDAGDSSAIRFGPFHYLVGELPFLIPLNPAPHNSRIWVHRLEEFYATIENANYDCGPGGMQWGIFTTIYGPGQRLGAVPVEPAQRRRAIRIV